MQHHIDISAMTFRRGSRAIFDNVDIKITRGKITAIMGPSGTGKTTLLRLIAGQLRPESGSIHVDGDEINQLNRGDLYQLRKRMGVLFQSGALFTDMNVFHNVAFPLKTHTSLSEQTIRQLVLMKLECVGLRGAHNLMPNELSGGMQRRVALARTIALDPDLVMYDEPFAGQDPIAMDVLVKLIKELNQSLGLTSIVVSHDVHEAASIADEIYVLSQGKVLAHGTPSEVMNSTDPAVSQFMHGKFDGPVAFHFDRSDYATDLMSQP